MSAFISLLRFELRYQVLSPTFVVSFGFFFLITFFATVSDQVQIGGPSSVHLNAPSAIALTLGGLGLFGLFIPTAMLSSGVIRDREFKTAELFHSTPVNPRTFVLGRFFGGYFAVLLAFASVPLAMYIGCLMPWLDAEQLGPMNAYNFFYVFFTLSAVNMLIAGLIFFTVANLTRSIFATYTALIAFLVIYFVGLAWAREPAYREIAALFDPMGLNTLRHTMQYWTPAQRNTELPAMAGVYLTNRALWISVAGGLLLFNLLAFRFRAAAGTSSSRKKADQTNETTEDVERISLPRATPSAQAAWQQLRVRAGFEARSVTRSIAFWILLALGVLNTTGNLLNLDSLYGTPSYPLTRVMLNGIEGAFTIIPLIVVVYYASELVWRERLVGISDVVDATPTPNWVFVLSKFVALVIVTVSLFAAAILTAVVIQSIKGYTTFELDQYLSRTVIDLIIPVTLIAVLSLFLQVVTNNRWIGILAVVFYAIAIDVAANFGYDHHLALYGTAPASPYSDMNGFGHFLGIMTMYMLYWGFWAVVLGALSYMLWNRGALRPVADRLGGLRNAGAGSKALVTVALLGVFISGGWIYYNTNIRNVYMNQPRNEERALAFEDTYRDKYETFPQPKIIGVGVQVDIFPQERLSTFTGEYQIINRTGGPIDTVLVDYDYRAKVREQALSGATLAESDPVHNVYRFSLSPRMAPGDTRTLSFKTDRPNPGFRNDGNVSSVVGNGTFLNGADGMPSLGFNAGKLLQPRNVRRRYDREPLPRAPKLEDERFWRTGALRPDSDWVTFTATVSTVPEQLAIAPGVPGARVGRGRPPILPVRDGPTHPELLLVSVGRLPNPGGRLERHQATGLLPRRARVQRRPNHGSHARLSRLLQHGLLAFPVSTDASLGVSRLRDVRAVLREYRTVRGEYRLRARPSRRRELRCRLLRDRPRSRPSVVGAPSDSFTQPGRDDDHRDVRPVRGPDRHRKEIRSAPDATVSAV